VTLAGGNAASERDTTYPTCGDHVTGRRSRGLRPYPHARGRPATCSSSASSR
jgi:hypothetical protein